jgi:hypothetical protein
LKNAKAPVELLAPRKVEFVSSLWMVMAALVTTAPVASLTVPEIEPRST